MTKTAEQIRKEKNEDLVERLKNGESLKNFNKEMSFFPPRSIIKKDSNEIKKLYGKDAVKNGDEQ